VCESRICILFSEDFWRWDSSSRWLERTKRFGKVLKILCLQVIVLDEASLRAIRSCARVARDGGGSFHREDRDERFTGHPRVLPRALQVLQCRSLPARVRLSLHIFRCITSHRIFVKYCDCDWTPRLVWSSNREILYILFFTDITRSELLLEYRQNYQSKWKSINHEIVSISIIRNQNYFCNTDILFCMLH